MPEVIHVFRGLLTPCPDRGMIAARAEGGPAAVCKDFHGHLAAERARHNARRHYDWEPSSLLDSATSPG